MVVKYSNEELLSAWNGLWKIRGYILDYIAPRIHGNRKLAYFYMADDERECELRIDAGGDIRLMVNGRPYRMEEGGDKTTDEETVIFLSVCAVPLLLNWKEAKKSLFGQVKEQEREYNAIMGFSI